MFFNAPAALPVFVSDLDTKTLFLITMHVEIMLGLLLFFAWAQNFSKRELAWWGSAHLLRAVSIMLLGLYGTVPDSVSIDLANAVLFASFSLTWCGARVFERLKPEPVLGLAGVAIWLLACRTQLFADGELRLLVGAGIVTAYIWATAYEFWRGREQQLVSRWPAIFMLFAHGALFLLRTPLITALDGGTTRLALSGWVELLSVEALLFTISIAFIMLAMAKERNEFGHRAAANTDPLTSIANRRGFLEQAQAAQRSGAAQLPAAVILFDLDNFKTINDRYGHAVGDRTLQIFAGVAAAHIGDAGLIGRWGGDEFVAMLHNTSIEIAGTVAERIRAAMEAAADDIDGRLVGATISSGLAFSSRGGMDLPLLLLEADQALYRAKAEGRNRLAISVVAGSAHGNAHGNAHGVAAPAAEPSRAVAGARQQAA